MTGESERRDRDHWIGERVLIKRWIDEKKTYRNPNVTKFRRNNYMSFRPTWMIFEVDNFHIEDERKTIRDER